MIKTIESVKPIDSKWDEYLIETRAIHTKDTLEKLKGLYSTNINDIDVGDVTKVFSEIRQIILFQKSRFSKVDFKECETEMEFYNGFIWDKLSNVALKMKEKKNILKSDFEVCKKYIEELEKVSKCLIVLEENTRNKKIKRYCSCLFEWPDW